MNPIIRKGKENKSECTREIQNELEKDVTNMLEKLLTEEKDNIEENISLSSISTSNLFGDDTVPELVPNYWNEYEIKNRKIIETSQENFCETQSITRKNRTSGSMKENVGLSIGMLEERRNPSYSQKNVPVINSINNFQMEQNQFPFMINNVGQTNSDFISEVFYQTFKGKFNYLIKNLNGSKLLQKNLSNTIPEILSKIFEEIREEIPHLIMHKYGNYFCQMFFFLLNENERIQFLFEISNNFLLISAHEIGNFSIQTILEKINSPIERGIILEAIQHGNTLPTMAIGKKSVHVLEKIVACFQEDEVNFIYEFVIQNFLHLSKNQNGLCLVKRVIIHANQLFNLKRLQRLLIDNFQYLVLDEYGNYTIQTALEYWNNFLISPILGLFINKFSKLSISKFSSNAVEKSLEKGGENFVNIFVEEIISKNKVYELIKNNYGNYVLQKALFLSYNNSKLCLINHILQNLTRIDDMKLIIKWKHICDSTIESIFRNAKGIDNNYKFPNNYNSFQSNHKGNM